MRETGTATRHRRLVLTTQILYVVGVTAGVALHLADSDQWHGFFDLRIYWDAMRWWVDGADLYDFTRPDLETGLLGYAYPPFAALCMLPMAWLSWHATIAVELSASLLVFGLTTSWLVDPLARRYGWPRWFTMALAVPLILAMEPVFQTLAFGQVNLFLVALVLGDLLFAVPRGWRWAGVGVGLATAVKLTPGIFIVYLLVTRRWRAAGTAAAVAAGATLLAAAVAPRASWRYWTDVVWDTGRVGFPDYASNQSLFGLLSRLADPHPASTLMWLLVVGGVGGFGLWRAARAAAAGDGLAGATLAGLVGVLVSPVSWTHHMYWVVPALVVLVDAAVARRRWWMLALAAGIYLAFADTLIWRYDKRPGHHYDGGLVGVLGENAFVLLVLLLLVILPVRVYLTSGMAAPATVKTPVAPSAMNPSRS